MSTSSKIHQAMLDDWAVRIADHKASGLPVSQWCSQNNLSIHKYFYWKRLLKAQAVDQMLPDIVPVDLPLVSETPVSQVPQVLFPTCSSCTTCVSARLTINDVSIELDSSASEDFIKSIIRAVRYA